MQRRDFLALGALLLPLRASASPPRRLVVVHLFGGNDGLNTVVPTGSAAYGRARPVLGLRPDEVVPLRGGLALHAALAPVAEMAVINGVGLPSPDRSHFHASEVWHRAGWTDGPGWLARGCRGDAVAVGRTCPLAFSGARTTPLCVDPEMSASVPPELQSPLDAMYRSAPSHLSATWRRLRDVSAAGGGDVFARARALLPRASVLHLTLDGFDTHAGQRDRHARALGHLAQGLTTLLRGEQQTLVMVFSEFGRRVEENASGGTDHGKAGPVLLVGAGVRPGLYGDMPSLTDLDDGDLRAVVDFRSVYATVLERWLRVDSSSVLGGRFDLIKCL